MKTTHLDQVIGFAESHVRTFEGMRDVAQKHVQQAQEHLAQIETQLTASRKMLDAAKAAREELKG
jgi:hypothetical protein